MALLAIESLEGLVEVGCTFLELLFEHILIINLLVRDFNDVDVLKTVVVAVDIVLVGTLTDVQHAHILAVDVEHGCVSCLPVKVCVAGHRALDDEVAEIQVGEIVAAVAQRERLELSDAGLLVGEELVGITLLVGVETLVGIEYHRLQGVRTRLSALNACLAQLVEGTLGILGGEELDVHRATPVTRLLVLLAVVILEETQ